MIISQMKKLLYDNVCYLKNHICYFIPRTHVIVIFDVYHSDYNLFVLHIEIIYCLSLKIEILIILMMYDVSQ